MNTPRISEDGNVKEARQFWEDYKKAHPKPPLDDTASTVLGLVQHIDRMQHYFNTLALLTGNDPEEAIDIVEEHLRSGKGHLL